MNQILSHPALVSPPPLRDPLRRGWRRSAQWLLALLLAAGGVAPAGGAGPVATTLSIADTSAIEPAANGTVNLVFTVSRTGDLGSQITVGYTTAAGTAQANTDFTPTTGTTTFASGSSTATIGIPIFGNGVYNNPSLSFTVQLTGIVNVVGPPVTLAAKSDFAAGSDPTSVTTGDLNGDGRPDLALAAYGGVTVFLNTTAPGAATPTFAAPVIFTAGAFPYSVAIGDLNGDGKPDLVVANSDSKNISVLLNTTASGSSTPSFAAHVDFAISSETLSVAIGDFNGDGKPDLAVAAVGSNAVVVLLNTTAPGATAPSFATPLAFATGRSPYSVAVADLDGDGRLDLAVASPSDDTVSVLLNTTAPGATAASFATRQPFTTGSYPISVAIGDLNGDGRPDLAVANFRGTSVSVLFNTSAAGAAVTFAAKADFAAGSNPRAVALGDLNGDGKPDLAVANGTSNTVSVLLGTTAAGGATPSFAAQKTFATGTYASSVAIAGFNGDGRPGLAVGKFGGSTVSVLLNTTALPAAAPTFTPDAGHATGTNPSSVASGDLNGDGKPDLAVANYSDGTVSVLLNTTPPGAATFSFAAPQTFSTEFGPNAVAIGDFNGDGRPDLAVANYLSDTVTVLLNTTAVGAITSTFAMPRAFATGAKPISVVVGDLNGDGKPDLAVANHNSDSVSVLIDTTAPGAVAPSFAPQQTFTTGSDPSSGSFPACVAIGDLNGDGKPDLAVANSASNGYSFTFAVRLNTTVPGATVPTFATKVDFLTGARPSFLALGDFNGDGRLDFVLTNSDTDTVSVFLNTTAPGAATPSLSAQQTFVAGSNPSAVAIGDFNGDGKADGAVANDDHTISVLRNSTSPGSTTASFDAHMDFATGRSPVSIAIGDFNGDGRTDMVSANAITANVSVLVNTPVSISTDTATGTITESDPGAKDDVAFTGGTKAIDIDVVANDPSAPGGAATITIVTPPAHGTLPWSKARCITTPAARCPSPATRSATVTRAPSPR